MTITNPPSAGNDRLVPPKRRLRRNVFRKRRVATTNDNNGLSATATETVTTGFTKVLNGRTNVTSRPGAAGGVCDGAVEVRMEVEHARGCDKVREVVGGHHHRREGYDDEISSMQVEQQSTGEVGVTGFDLGVPSSNATTICSVTPLKARSGGGGGGYGCERDAAEQGAGEVECRRRSSEWISGSHSTRLKQLETRTVQHTHKMPSAVQACQSNTADLFAGCVCGRFSVCSIPVIYSLISSRCIPLQMIKHRP